MTCLAASGWMDNMLRPTPQFASSSFDSTLKKINNNLSGSSRHSLSFSDKGEFVFDGLQRDREKEGGRREEQELDTDAAGEFSYTLL